MIFKPGDKVVYIGKLKGYKTTVTKDNKIGIVQELVIEESRVKVLFEGEINSKYCHVTNLVHYDFITKPINLI